MKELRGQCSCGAVEFKFSPDSLRAYQCHCSLCQKASGSAYSTTLMAPENRFSWVRGAEHISSYEKDSGYKVSFCSRCGSPVPNKFRGLPLFSIPAGSLDGEPDLEIVAKIYLGSQVKWDNDRFNGKCFSERPSLDEVFNLLGVTTEP